MVSPASTRPLPLASVGAAALLVRVIESRPTSGVVVVAVGAETVAPAGSVPVASARFTTRPASRSAWRRRYVARQVELAPGASEATAGHGSASSGSEIRTPVSVWSPELVTTRV